MDVLLEPVETAAPQKKGWLRRFQAVFEILLVSGIFSSFLASAPFYQSIRARSLPLQSAYIVCAYVGLEALITLLLIALLMKAHGERLADFGLRFRRLDFLIGISIVPLLFILNAIVSVFIQTFFPKYFSPRNALLDIIRTPAELTVFLITALIAGGIKEELQRAFILVRFRNHLGGAWIGLILWSSAFGAGHYVQGWQGMIAAGFLGLIFGLVYLFRKNLFAPMLAHGLYDATALLLFWFFRNFRF
jgi:membrane protease YdiL (CAAX protease family)